MSSEHLERINSIRQTHRWWRPRGLPLFELLVIGLGLALFVPWGTLLSRVRDDEPERSIAYAHLAVDPYNGPRELVAFDETSGEVLARLPGGNIMAFALRPDGTQVYIATTTWDDTGSTEILLTAYETGEWTVEQQVGLDANPSAIALSPDGDDLLLLVSDDLGDTWLERRDAATLEAADMRQRAVLPDNCQAWRLWTTATHVVTLCPGNGSSVAGSTPAPLALHAVDVASMQVVASMPLNGADVLRSSVLFEVVVSADRTTLYVVFADLQILEVEARTLALLRNVRDHVRMSQRVGRVSGAPGQLHVAVMDEVAPSALAQLRRFQLPSLEELPARSLPDGAWSFAPGPDRMLYQWSSGSASLRLVDPETNEETPRSLAGPVEQGVVNIVRMHRAD